MSRYDNPARGAVQCPVCHSVATVHHIGEGKLIAAGEPPKNSRNIGLKYYRCPKCGNSSMSRSVNDYIEKNMATDETELKLTEPAVSDSVEKDDSSQSTEPSSDKVSSGNLTENKTEQVTESKLTEKASLITPKRVFIILGVLAAGLWVSYTLFPKKSEQEVSDGSA